MDEPSATAIDTDDAAAAAPVAAAPVYDFVNFELFYDHWHAGFRARSDPVLLFFHYLMIQNEFKVLHPETLKKSELLPPGWNDFEQIRELVYYKQEAKVRVEVVKAREALNFVVQRDGEEAVMSVAVDEHIEPDYQVNDYTKVFRMATVFSLYTKFQTAISMARAPDDCVDHCGLLCCCDAATPPPPEESEPAKDPPDPSVVMRRCEVRLVDFTAKFLELRRRERRALRRGHKRRLSERRQSTGPLLKRIKAEPDVPPPPQTLTAPQVTAPRKQRRRRNTIHVTRPKPEPRERRLSLKTEPAPFLVHLDEIIDEIIAC